MRKVSYVLENGVVTSSYAVAVASNVHFKVTISQVPEDPGKMSKKRMAMRKSVK